MTKLTRKQREIADRHALFLSISRDVLSEEGFHQLSMERVAELAEYSRGTVYQHFPCKEEILIQLCIDAMSQLLALFRQAAAMQGQHRERFTAVFHAHYLWVQLEPKNACLLQLVSSDGVKDKVKPESLQRYDELELQLKTVPADIVLSAQQHGDLADTDISAAEIVFSLWSFAYGGQLLCSYDMNLKNLGISDPQRALCRTVNAVLDGFGWQPLYKPQDHKQLHERFATDIFKDEYRKIKAIASPTP